MATVAELIGTPVHASEFDLGDALEPGKKATGVGSAIPIGRVAFLTGSTGIWAIATAGSTGRIAIIPKLHQGDANTDSSSNVVVAARPGAQYIVEANGAIKPGSQVLPDTGGKVKTSGGTQGFAVYKGHNGEGSAGNPPTDAAAAEAVIIELSGDVV